MRQEKAEFRATRRAWPCKSAAPENNSDTQMGPAQRATQPPEGTWGWRAPFPHASTSSRRAPVSAVQVLSGEGKGGRRWQASTHLLEPVPSIVSANNSLSANLWISSGSLHAFTIPLPQPESPSLLFTALWTVRVLLCTPCSKGSRKETKLSLSQVPKLSSLTWWLSICGLQYFVWFIDCVFCEQHTQPTINTKNCGKIFPHCQMLWTVRNPNCLWKSELGLDSTWHWWQGPLERVAILLFWVFLEYTGRID